MGPDKIHGRVPKNCASSLSKPLASLFTTSYYSSSIPNEWKLALASSSSSSIAGSIADVENYRLISLTCIIMKVMDRIVRDELMVKCGHLIDPRQHGFLKNRSCTTQ